MLTTEQCGFGQKWVLTSSKSKTYGSFGMRYKITRFSNETIFEVISLFLVPQEPEKQKKQIPRSRKDWIICFHNEIFQELMKSFKNYS